MGEWSDAPEPSGFGFLVNQMGNIFCGTFTPDLKMEGFCIIYLGNSDLIEAGWFTRNVKNGNCMSLHAHDLTVYETTGWYLDGVRIGHMKPDRRWPPFTRANIFEELPKSTLKALEGIVEDPIAAKFTSRQFPAGFAGKDQKWFQNARKIHKTIDIDFLTRGKFIKIND